ncbi:cytochrome P450 [Lentzea sp. NPDC004782]|uniref:cytochrome P450 n=1 Tax=Lentzea sp. NPDC004782 TaxID=3154458 RepID=UPI0033BB3C05
METETLSAENFSHNEESYIPDPFPFYERMREESPAYFSEGIFGGTWLFFRYEDCLKLMTDERLSNARAAVPLWFLPAEQKAEFADMIAIFERWLAFHDGQSHTKLRRHANRSYRPFSDEALEPRIQALVDRLLDDVDPGGFDLMRDFAFPLPAMVIADLLGVSVDAHPELTRWTDDIAHLFGSTSVTTEHLHRTRQSTLELAEFLAKPESIAQSERENGLLHMLRATQVNGAPNDEDNIVAQAALLLFAGVASIRYQIGNSVYALDRLATPEQRDLLMKPETAANAVEELLRFCTPVQFVGRVPREDFVYTVADGQQIQIKAGQPLMLYVASANRDPQKFPGAGGLVLDRPAPNQHLTFGAGRHICFGDPLVRQTLRIALQSLYRRMPGLHVPVQELDWNNNLGFHGFVSLHLAADQLVGAHQA